MFRIWHRTRTQGPKDDGQDSSNFLDMPCLCMSTQSKLSFMPASHTAKEYPEKNA